MDKSKRKMLIYFFTKTSYFSKFQFKQVQKQKNVRKGGRIGNI